MSHEDFNAELDALRENLPASVEETGASKSVAQITYSIDLAKRIVDLYAQGKGLHFIAHQSEMPAYSTLLKWSKTHPELSKMLRSVREARALHFEDAAIAAAESAQGKDADRLKIETYKWASEVNDPSTYGKKVAHSGDLGVTKIIKVFTGFGPLPDSLQFPKLRPDGTIDKSPPIEVASEVVDVTGPDDRSSHSEDASHHKDDAGPNPESARHAHAPVRSSGDGESWPQSLQSVEGLTNPDGSAEGPPLRGDQLRGGGTQDLKAGAAPG